MSEAYEPNDGAGGNRCTELTPEQGALLIEELKRFEPYLALVEDWWEGLEPHPQEAVYEVGGTELRLMWTEGSVEDVAGSWSISWFEELPSEDNPDTTVMVEHRHGITTDATDRIAYSYYERVDWAIDQVSGRSERIQSPEEQEAVRAFRKEEDREAAVQIFADSVHARIDTTRVMEQLTGIDVTSFNTERFYTVMALLSRVGDPACKKLD